MVTYRAFGLTYGSDLVLPGVPEGVGSPDVVVRREPTPEWQGEPTVQYGERFRIRGQEFLIRFPAQRFSAFMSQGNLMQVECAPEADAAASLHVLGSCTGAILFQRGLIPLHGNSVTTGQSTITIAGRIGSGKSTTTLALVRRGHRLLADDISGVSFDTPEPRVVPGFPRLKLWQNTLEHFGIDSGSLRPIRNGLKKFHVAVPDQFCGEPQRLDAIYVLHPTDTREVAIRPLSGMEKLHELRPHLYKVRFRDAVRNWPPTLGKVCRLADSVRINIVERPKEGASIEAVADAIERDVRALS